MRKRWSVIIIHGMHASFSVLLQMEPWRWDLLKSKVLSVWRVNIGLLESWQSP